ncbi:MAG: helix-turn-helix domain-containing protein [Solobacterium sp.]|jgi:lichenan operon transcriptional antiterminator|nr:helix-turn-helix domain-containing protein [Solobacterium sp.]MCH4265335.1 helix-turn-helix domain-containing protein [Solobacterium sp.]
MEANKRQVAILYELIMNEGNHNYSELCSTFNVSIKTMRKDIQTINDTFSSSGLHVYLSKGHGFYLKADRSEQLEGIKKQLQYRFIGTDDIQKNLGSRKNHILFYLFTNGKYTRLDDLSISLNLNERSISYALRSVREVLNTYQIKLSMRPHYGLYMEGRELDIRYCYTDTVCFYSDESGGDLFSDSLSLLHLDVDEKSQVTKICLNYISSSGIPLSEIETRKLIVLIMISHQRSLSHNAVTFTDKQREIIKQYPTRLVNVSKLIADLEKMYHESIDGDEASLIKMFIICNLDYSIDKYKNAIDERVLRQSDKIQGNVFSMLRKLTVIGAKNERQFSKCLSPVFQEIALRECFSITEHNPNSYLKKAVNNSPLSASLGMMCFKRIQEMTEQEMGEYTYIRLSLAIYACIRETHNTKLNDIAIITPSDKESGESLKYRIMDRFSNIISSVDILTLTDVMTNSLSKYSCVVLFENEKPLGLKDNVKQLQVDYLFLEKDVKNFYEEVAIPSRKYERAFAMPKKSDYLLHCGATSISEIKEIFRNEISDKQMKRQIDQFELSSDFICNNTLNIILFCSKEKDCFSKLLVLNRSIVYKGLHFSRVFVHAVNLKGNMIRIKTAEKVTRNLTLIEDTNDTVLATPVIDFYDYYIHYKKIKLS